MKNDDTNLSLEKEFENVKTRRNELTLEQKTKIKWLVAASVTTCACGLVFWSIFQLTNQPTQVVTGDAQDTSDLALNATAAYAQADITLRKALTQRMHTTPITPEKSGITQLAIANVGGEIKNRIADQLRDPNSAAYNDPVRHPVVATHKAIANNVIKTQIVPAISGKIKKATLVIEYTDGSKKNLNRTPSQVLVSGLTDFEAFQYSFHPVAYQFNLIPYTRDLQAKYTHTADAHINAVAYEEQLDPYASMESIRQAYRDAFLSSWVDIPTVLPKSQESTE